MVNTWCPHPSICGTLNTNVLIQMQAFSQMGRRCMWGAGSEWLDLFSVLRSAFAQIHANWKMKAYNLDTKDFFWAKKRCKPIPSICGRNRLGAQSIQTRCCLDHMIDRCERCQWFFFSSLNFWNWKLMHRQWCLCRCVESQNCIHATCRADSTQVDTGLTHEHRDGAIWNSCPRPTTVLKIVLSCAEAGSVIEAKVAMVGFDAGAGGVRADGAGAVYPRI
jgi:hypothetical protein